MGSLNPVVRSTITPSFAVGGARSISATAGKQKGPVEATKDTLKKADEVLSGAAVKGIEKGGMCRVDSSVSDQVFRF
jgi:hypothetical protein